MAHQEVSLRLHMHYSVTAVESNSDSVRRLPVPVTKAGGAARLSAGENNYRFESSTYKLASRHFIPESKSCSMVIHIHIGLASH